METTKLALRFVRLELDRLIKQQAEIYNKFKPLIEEELAKVFTQMQTEFYELFYKVDNALKHIANEM